MEEEEEEWSEELEECRMYKERIECEKEIAELEVEEEREEEKRESKKVGLLKIEIKEGVRRVE